MQKLTKEQVEAAFTDDDFRVLRVPENFLSTIDFSELDYLGWKDPSGHYGFVVVEYQDRPEGLVFRMNPSEGKAAAGMCSLCMSVHKQGTRAVTVTSRSKPYQSLGIHICKDFNCSDVVRGKLPGVLMSETISAGKKIERLQVNLRRFVAKVLQLDAV